MQLVTVVIPSLNAAKWIAGCLDSVRDIADEILIADAGSTDATLDIVRRHGDCRIICETGLEPAELEDAARRRAKHPWVLRMLPRERLSPDLAKEVQDLLAKEPADHAFRITRRYLFWGRMLRYGAFRFDSPVRLFRRDAARFKMQDGQVEVAVDSGAVGQMSAKLQYDACDDLAGYVAELARHAVCEAAAGHRQNTSGRWPMTLGRVAWRFLESFLFRGGCLDGRTGFHASCLWAISAYLCDAAQWQAVEAKAPAGAPSVAPRLTIFAPETEPTASSRKDTASETHVDDGKCVTVAATRDAMPHRAAA